MIPFLQKTLYSLADLLLPAICPLCGKNNIPHPESLCSTCEGEILLGRVPPLTRTDSVPEILSCRFYEGAVRKYIKELKYSERHTLINVFNKIIYYFIEKDEFFSHKIDLIIPVPLHRTKHKKRGFNQSELIAAILSQALNAPSLSYILLKTRRTHSQAGLSREKRIKNLAGSFAAGNIETIKNKSILLVDDVITTGATLDTCGSVLLRAGVRSVRGFTLAKVA
ncbi:MAG: ComF family protein [Candidatus Omnitrophica bacterium]|nr:ComF family protein [Candidatus Omnitrophota bacterium]